ncbi:hypothetical protein Dimus_019561 [Dionaea muscipula]
MATYRARINYRYLTSNDHLMAASDVAGAATLELHESDVVWDVAEFDSFEPPGSRVAAKQKKKEEEAAATKPEIRVAASGAAVKPSSLPVNVPDWSKILRDEYKANRRRRDFNECGSEEEGENGERRVPPHEFLAKSRQASFSVHEGIGRTLKGRDLSRVRNSIWEKVGFLD